ncbi:MAG: LuxR C-terminal-related transcriptional regulator [Oscillospiraceae bacterium]|nr:LuxR C-terminal-related transcriptional regulator [Oscillospiraceae bacterium]
MEQEMIMMLSENEWNAINNILLELYTISNIEELSKKLMRVFRMLIPYTAGYFVLLDEEQRIIPDKNFFISPNSSDNFVSEYLNHYYDEDYLKYLYEITTETTVYKDTSILDDDIRKSTDFYKKFLKPSDIPYGCGILIIKNRRIIAIMNLFRSEQLGDFSDKDVYILNLLKKHIENMVHNTYQTERKQIAVDKCFANASAKYELTNREHEILKLLSEGLSNSEICDKLMISLSTAKKHIYNIYTKTGVKSRTQLINLVYSDGD